MQQEEQDSVNIQDMLFSIKKHILMIVIMVVVGTLSGFLLSSFIIHPKYEADATIVVTAGQASESAAVTYDQLNTAQQLVNSCAVILKSDAVLDKAIQDLDLKTTSDKLLKSIDISAVSETEILDITVKYSDPETAVQIANEISKEASSVLIKTVKASSVEIVSPAKINRNPVSPNVFLYTGGGFLIAFLLGMAVSILLDKLDDTFTTEDSLQKYLEISVLGVIPSCRVRK